MELRFESSATETASMDTQMLRGNFLVQQLMQDKVSLTYTLYDRMIIGGVKPLNSDVVLQTPAELKSEFFLQRREMGIINVGGRGHIKADGQIHELNKLDCVYLSKGTKEVIFATENVDDQSSYFFISVPAHASFENKVCTKEQATPVDLGTQATGNMRTIYKYIHLSGIRSCQLVMGLTLLKEGSVWNSVPPHTHTRRTEVYFYFDIPEDQRVFHFMGKPTETRHLIVNNHEAVISPPWSVHFGSGTMNYGFIWAMAGENQAFDDMDVTPINSLL